MTSLNWREIRDLSEFLQYGALLDATFPILSGGHYWDDFPIWDPSWKISGLKRWGFFHAHQLVSCVGVRLASLWTFAQVSVPVALIGGVATDPHWGRRGLASEGVSRAVQWAQLQGAQAVLLWGSEHRMYQRLGFTLTGTQQLVPLKKVLQLCPSRGRSVSIHSGWNQKIFSLRQKYSNGLKLAGEDQTWFGAHKNVEWFFVGSAEAPQAYVARGRGMDLGGVVHEWGGDSELVLALLDAIESKYPASWLLGHPRLFAQMGWDALNTLHMSRTGSLLESFSGVVPEPTSQEFLCLMKPLAKTTAWAHDFWIWGLDAV